MDLSESRAMPSPDALLVLGMHRSGTSAVTGALARLGLHLGESLVPAAADNPGGYFEHSDVVALHENLFAALGRSWDDVREMPAGWEQGPEAKATSDAIRRDILPSLRSQRPWAVKDPRMCRTLPLWTRVLAEDGVVPVGLLVIRHPDEVAGSLAARDGIPATQARLLWLRHVLESVRASADMPRAVIGYPQLLSDPDATLASALTELGVRSATPASGGTLSEFVSSQARHHTAGLQVHAEDDWHGLALSTYQCLTDSESRWTAMSEIEQRFAELCERDKAWITTLGAAAQAADDRKRKLTAQALGAEVRANGLQARLDDTDAALARIEVQSVQRLGELQAMDARLKETDAAFAAEQARSIERLSAWEVATAQLELATTQLELATAQAEVATAQLDAAQRERDALREHAQALEARLTRIEQSRAWRAITAVRRLLLKMGIRGGAA